MIARAEAAGRISPGDTLIEATSGNTGIALAMAAAIRGYRMVLIMPENMSEERRASMAAFGAELVLVPRGSMETARDLAKAMEAAGEGTVLDQFGNGDNPEAHFAATGPELWEQTGGRITHFVSSMGTTGTIMGVSRYLKGRNPDVQIVGLQPAEGAAIPGIRRWPPEYLPSIYEDARVDLKLDISQKEAEDTTRALAREEGIFCGVSSGGAVAGALRVAAGTRDAVIACIVCDRGDRYLSTGVFDAPAELPFWGGERRGSLLGGDGAAGQSGGRVADCNALGFRTALPAVLNEHRRALVFFSGGPAREPSWCPDCRRVAPLVEEAAAAAGALLLHVDVGDRAAWKDPLRSQVGET
jgi:cysteine synthase B